MIADNVSYSLPEFLNETKLGKSALAEARNRGLPIVRAGGRGFVRGRDWNEFLGQLAETGQSGKTPGRKVQNGELITEAAGAL